MVYIVLVFNFGLFLLKYVEFPFEVPEEFKKTYCGMTYINLASLFVLVALMTQTNEYLALVETDSLKVNALSTNFTTMETLIHSLAVFNVISTGVCVSNKMKEPQEVTSPKSNSTKKRRGSGRK